MIVNERTIDIIDERKGFIKHLDEQQGLAIEISII